MGITNNEYSLLKNYTAREILTLSRAEKEDRKRLRLLAVSLFLEGHSQTEVTNRLKVTREGVNTWIANYLAYGLKGRDSYLILCQKRQFSAYI